MTGKKIAARVVGAGCLAMALIGLGWILGSPSAEERESVRMRGWSSGYIRGLGDGVAQGKKSCVASP